VTVPWTLRSAARRIRSIRVRLAAKKAARKEEIGQGEQEVEAPSVEPSRVRGSQRWRTIDIHHRGQAPEADAMALKATGPPAAVAPRL